ncbi:MAG: uridine kinase [Saprospiraceae bacterium]
MLIIGISGGSGSGKTSFIKDVQSKFAQEEITILSQDDYYFPKEKQLIDKNGVINFDLPTSIDLKSFSNDLQRLKAGKTVERTEYTFNNKTVKPKTLIFKPSKILIVEGLFVFHVPEMYKMLDLKIMIYASSALAVIRRIQRDKVERNYPLEDVLYRYEHHVLPAYLQYIEPYMDRVDIIINNNINYNKALDMMISYIKSQ